MKTVIEKNDNSHRKILINHVTLIKRLVKLENEKPTLNDPINIVRLIKCSPQFINFEIVLDSRYIMFKIRLITIHIWPDIELKIYIIFTLFLMPFNMLSLNAAICWLILMSMSYVSWCIQTPVGPGGLLGG